jgi:hypothetical protein
MLDRNQFQMRQRTMPDHMANLDKLLPGSLRGAKFAVVEIIDAVQVDARRGEDRKTGNVKYEPAVVLRYKEFENRIHWLNKMGVNILIDVFGDDEAQWIGNRVPIVVKEDVKNPTEGGKQDMLWIANADEWERLFAESDEALAKTTAKPSNAAAATARAAAEKRKTSQARTKE